MEIPNENLIKVLTEYMEEYAFGHSIEGYDAFDIAESMVFKLFTVDINDLHRKASSIVNNEAIERNNWGECLFTQLTGKL